MLAILTMLTSLRVAPGGSAPPIPSAALHDEASPGRDGKAGVPIEPESWIGEVAVWTMLSRSGLGVTAVIGVQFRVCRLQRLGLRSRASW